MNLKHLSDAELLKSTDLAVKNEMAATTRVLHHLREIERRRLYAAEKFKSLYDMAIRKYGYTEDQAMYRISAMRLLKELPEIEEKISRGSLTLTHLNLARTHFRNELKHSKQELTREAKVEILKKLEKTSARESKMVLRSHSSLPIEIPRDEIKPLTEDKVLFKFAADKSVEDQVKELKGLLAHSHPDLSLGELLKKLCELGRKEWSRAREPKKSSEKFQVTKEQVLPGTFRVTALKNPSTSQGGTHAPKLSKTARDRFVWQRDEEKCTNCGSRFALQEDHRQAKAKGGPDTPENLRLLCRSCNQRAAIETFGLKKMDLYLNKIPSAVKSPVVAYVRSNKTMCPTRTYIRIHA